MPTPTSIRVPSYRLHKASGQAVVTLCGRDVYLGPYGSPESKQLYERHVAEWLANGRRPTAPFESGSLTVNELVLAYARHAKASYDRATYQGTIRPGLRRVVRLYGSAQVVEFGPLALKAVREQMLAETKTNKRNETKRLARAYINRMVQWIKTCFRWGVAEGMVPPSVLHGLEAVTGLRRGRTEAREPDPIGPVADAVVERTLPHLPPVVRDMVLIQRYTGARPGEVCAMTTGQLDTSGEVWLYKPLRHKTAHHGHRRMIAIGPKAQELLRPYLRTELDRALFSPADSEAERKRALRAARKTPMTPSQRKRDERRAKRPRARVGEAYTVGSYRQAIWRACERAGIPRWTPNQLRHTRATELRKLYGLDGAGAILGHSKLETTQIYAERAEELATKIALATG